MAKFEHLNIYKKAYDLLIVYHKISTQFPKAHKYTLGQSVIETLEKSILEIITVNNQTKKNFTHLLLLLEQVKLKTRLLKSLAVISKKTYCFLFEEIVNLLRQAQGWQSYSQQVRCQSQEATATLSAHN